MDPTSLHALNFAPFLNPLLPPHGHARNPPIQSKDVASVELTYSLFPFRISRWSSDSLCSWASFCSLCSLCALRYGKHEITFDFSMAPLLLSVESGKSPGVSSGFADIYKSKLCISGLEHKKPFASVAMAEDKSFDFLRVLRDGIIAGGTAGVVVETVLYPIDTIKTRLQAAHGGSKVHWKGLYSGLAGNLAGVLPASAIFVGIYEPTKQKLLKLFPDNLSAFAHMTAAAIGGAASSLIRVPTEVVKQRMQTRQFASAPDAVRLIVAKEGFRGLYAGYGSFLLRDLPFDAIQFCIYEQLRIGYRVAAKRELSDQEIAMIGAFAGAITGAITTPLDVLKTRLMTQGSTKQYSGLLSCTQTIIREEGPAALLKGIGPRMLWIGIGGSIFFGVLEKSRALLAQQYSPRNLKSDSLKQK